MSDRRFRRVQGERPWLTLFLCGDVMLGRGIDQILPHPGDPALWERHVRDARTYIELAEDVNGPITRPVDFSWPWGDALPVLDQAAPDVRVVNLETSITRSADAAPGKAVHYRMAPANIACLAAARPDVCALANNHIMDFGQRGLTETLRVLASAGMAAAGAGCDVDRAWQPAVVPVAKGGRVLMFSFGTPCSGIPAAWAAAERAGVAFLPDLSPARVAEITGRVQAVKRPGDVVVASIHWGSNWGYQVAREQTRFAYGLVDGGVDIVHGHSAHHPRPIEIYHGRLVLYSCGDLIDDYEGISGYERYRDDLRLLYLVTVERTTGRLTALRMAPMQTHRLRLRRAGTEDCEWLCRTFNRLGRRYGTRVALDPDGMLELTCRARWRG